MSRVRLRNRLGMSGRQAQLQHLYTGVFKHMVGPDCVSLMHIKHNTRSPQGHG